MSPHPRIAALAALAVVPLGLAGCTSEPSPSAAPATGGAVNCGDRIEAVLAGASPAATLDGSFPGTVARGGGTFSGTVTVTARQALAGVASPAADVAVVRGGEVVATPLPKDAVGVQVELPAGASQAFEAVGSVTGCAGSGAPLAPGRYEVYAVVTVVGEGGPGSEAVVVGGPWPLDVG